MLSVNCVPNLSSDNISKVLAASLRAKDLPGYIDMYPLLGNKASANDESSSSKPHHPHHYDGLDGVVLSYLLSQQQLLMLDSTNSSQSAEISVAASNQGQMEEKIQSSKKRKKAATPRKRSSGKKDRHSKICTAQGPRDRRMRLSVPIARQFFDLQDMLGFDKASKTIDWLFTYSKSAIKELKQHLVLPTCSTSTIGTAQYINSLSSSAESNEVVSQTMQTHCALKNRDRMNMRRSCMVGKGSRDAARARARDRTREKLRIRSSCQANQDEANPKDLGLCLGEEAEKHTNHELLEQGRKNSMTRNNADDHKTITGRSMSARSRPSLEDVGCEFPGFTGNWGTKMQSFHYKMTTNLNESFTGNNLLQVENPSTPIMGLTSNHLDPSSTTTSRLSFNSSSSQEQNCSGTSIFNASIPEPNAQEVLNPCSVKFMPNQDQDHNPNSIFFATLISPDQNPGHFLKFN